MKLYEGDIVKLNGFTDRSISDDPSTEYGVKYFLQCYTKEHILVPLFIRDFDVEYVVLPTAPMPVFSRFEDGKLVTYYPIQKLNDTHSKKFFVAENYLTKIGNIYDKPASEHTENNTKTKEEKAEIVKCLSPDQLVKLFLNLHDNFDPICEDSCDSYEIAKQEIIRRLGEVEEPEDEDDLDEESTDSETPNKVTNEMWDSVIDGDEEYNEKIYNTPKKAINNKCNCDKHDNEKDDADAREYRRCEEFMKIHKNITTVIDALEKVISSLTLIIKDEA